MQERYDLRLNFNDFNDGIEINLIKVSNMSNNINALECIYIGTDEGQIKDL